MSTGELSTFERTLLVLAILAVSLSIALSLCIGLILPPTFISPNAEARSLMKFCACQQKEPPSELQCLPNVFIPVSKNDVPFVTSSTSNHAYLVSLSTSSYADDDSERQYSCPGVILSERVVLAGHDCVFHHHEWFDLDVRSGSIYWSSGGQLHKVKKVDSFLKKGPACLTINPKFKFDAYFQPIKISDDLQWNSAETLYWEGTNKNKPFQSRRWSKESCTTDVVDKGTIENAISCEDVVLSGRPLVANGTLVAFKIGLCKLLGRTNHLFINFQSSSYEKWIMEIIIHGDSEFWTHFHSDQFVTPMYSMSGECVENRNEFDEITELTIDVYNSTTQLNTSLWNTTEVFQRQN